MRSCLRNHGWRLTAVTAAGLIALAATAFAANPAAPTPDVIRAPIGPRDIPEMLPGRWRVSLCIHEDDGHAWIRLEHCETGEVRTIGRFHLLVGGWFDREHLRWHYAPTFRTGLHMDREQRIEFEDRGDETILLTQIVENPQLLAGGKTTGHGLVRNNCVTYTRDAWYVLTGEYFDLPAIHTPPALRKAVETAHPEVVRTVNKPAKRWVWTVRQRDRRD